MTATFATKRPIQRRLVLSDPGRSDTHLNDRSFAEYPAFAPHPSRRERVLELQPHTRSQSIDCIDTLLHQIDFIPLGRRP